MTNNQDLKEVLRILNEVEKVMGKALGILSQKAKRKYPQSVPPEEIAMANRITEILRKIRQQIEELEKTVPT